MQNNSFSTKSSPESLSSFCLFYIFSFISQITSSSTTLPLNIPVSFSSQLGHFLYVSDIIARIPMFRNPPIGCVARPLIQLATRPVIGYGSVGSWASVLPGGCRSSRAHASPKRCYPAVRMSCSCSCPVHRWYNIIN